MRYHLISVRLTIIKKTKDRKGYRKELLYTVDRYVNDTAAMENNTEIAQNIKNRATI